jgi:L-seryl-tRNA(Ser) seleniumtransferase
MDHEIEPDSIYQNIGVTPVINAAGPITMFGGTKLRTEVHSVMNAASQTMIDLHQLNDKAGEILASYAGAEAGMVTSGSAGALILRQQQWLLVATRRRCRNYQILKGCGMRL